MIEREIPVINKLGLHARASAKLVQTTTPFKSRIMLAARGREIDAKSIMGVMMLAAGVGSVVVVRAEGDDAEAAVAAVVDLFARRFDEGE
ncbi:HPr family phosphocarrier protein [Solilutibacter silvestris]|uniref:Phosphocarrier HPr protein n=1 Tax=Solilutibacter silvestris TaxID=1645665 RepID=A0A2K1Q344_9GAMM|nr:HPr family phosphocarrier protein [Lysobacter silvestris]PNS09367.1 phosphocarrier HPr protein [Lysobacter silvestris]